MNGFQLVYMALGHIWDKCTQDEGSTMDMVVGGIKIDSKWSI